MFGFYVASNDTDNDDDDDGDGRATNRLYYMIYSMLSNNENASFELIVTIFFFFLAIINITYISILMRYSCHCKCVCACVWPFVLLFFTLSFKLIELFLYINSFTFKCVYLMRFYTKKTRCVNSKHKRNVEKKHRANDNKN